MSTQPFVAGVRFWWQNVKYEIKHLLPDDQVSIENIFTGEVYTEQLLTLIGALCDGTLYFVTTQYGEEEPSVWLEHTEIDKTTVNLIIVDDQGNPLPGRAALIYCFDTLTCHSLGYYIQWDEIA